MFFTFQNNSFSHLLPLSHVALIKLYIALIKLFVALIKLNVALIKLYVALIKLNVALIKLNVALIKLYVALIKLYVPCCLFLKCQNTNEKPKSQLIELNTRDTFCPSLSSSIIHHSVRYQFFQFTSFLHSLNQTMLSIQFSLFFTGYFMTQIEIEKFVTCFE